MPIPNLKYDNSKPIRKGFTFDETRIKKNIEKNDDGSLKSLSLEGYITNDNKDEMGDVLTKEGWILDRFKSNPVVLYNHGHDILGGLPIGKGEIKEDDKGIWAKTIFFVNKLTEPIVQAVAEGFLKGFSVGFIPLDGKYDEKEDTYYITSKKLMEYSVVTIPCLESALGSLGVKSMADYKAKTGDILTEMKKQWKKSAEENNEPKFLSLEDAIKEAEEKAGVDGEIEVDNVKDFLEKQQEPTVIQTLIFHKETFSKEEAEKWLKEHEFKVPEAVEKENTYHYRQRDPDDFKEDSFRTIRIAKGIVAVIGKLKDLAKSVNDDLRDNPPPPTTVEDNKEPLVKTVDEDILTALQTQTAILGLILDQLKILTDALNIKDGNKLASSDNSGVSENNNQGEPDGSTEGNNTVNDDNAKAWDEFAKATEKLANATKV